MPPEGEAVAEPLVLPLQLGLVPVAETINRGGFEMVTPEEAVQLLTSVTVIVYVPAEREETTEVMAPVDQL